MKILTDLQKENIKKLNFWTYYAILIFDKKGNVRTFVKFNKKGMKHRISTAWGFSARPLYPSQQFALPDLKKLSELGYDARLTKVYPIVKQDIEND